MVGSIARLHPSPPFHIGKNRRKENASAKKHNDQSTVVITKAAKMAPEGAVGAVVRHQGKGARDVAGYKGGKMVEAAAIT